MHLLRIDDRRIVNLDHLIDARWEGPIDRRRLDLHIRAEPCYHVLLPDGEQAYLVWRILSRLALDPLSETIRRPWPAGREWPNGWGDVPPIVDHQVEPDRPGDPPGPDGFAVDEGDPVG